MEDVEKIEAAVAAKLYKALKRNPKFNQKRLAAELLPPMSQPNLSNVLRGKTPLHLGYFLQICRLLKIDPIIILSGLGMLNGENFTTAQMEDRERAAEIAGILVEIERFYPEAWSAFCALYRAIRDADPALNPDGKRDRRESDRRKKGI